MGWYEVDKVRGGFSKYKLECYLSTSNKSWRY